MSRVYGLDFETFNRNFFSAYANKRNVKFFDRTITRVMKDKERIAEITLAINGVVGHYSVYEVKISHKQNGVIANHRFLFSQYFKPENRIDVRKDYNGSPHITTTTCKDGVVSWYIVQPSPIEIEALAERIWTYIDLYE